VATMRAARHSIVAGTFERWSDEWLRRQSLARSTHT
jgi:hypothetical protein